MLPLPGDASGLFVVELIGDPVGVVSPQQLALLFVKPFEDAVAAPSLRFAAGAHASSFGLDDRSQPGLTIGRENDAAVVVLQQGLGAIRSLVALPAATVLLLGADEVVVGAAVAGVAGVGQTAATLAAEQQPLQIMRLLTIALAAAVVCTQDLLHLIKGFLGYERLMPSWVVPALVGDDADVVGIGQDSVDIICFERLRAGPAIAARQEPPGFEQIDEIRQRVVTGGIGRKGPLDERCALLVQDDGPDIPAVGAFDDVQIAERCGARCAAALGFLRRAFDDLGRQVLRVVLREAGQHAVHQAARRRLVDVLGRTHEPGAGQLDVKEHVGVVSAVAGKAIDFPEDDVVDIALLTDADQHPSERWPIISLGALGSFDVLANDVGVQFAGLTAALLALAVDG